MNTILHTLWRMSIQGCILILIVLAARQLLKKYSGFYTRLLWLLVIVRLLCPVLIETDFSLLPDFSAHGTEGNFDVLADHVSPDTLAFHAPDSDLSGPLTLSLLAANQPFSSGYRNDEAPANPAALPDTSSVLSGKQGKEASLLQQTQENALTNATPLFPYSPDARFPLQSAGESGNRYDLFQADAFLQPAKGPDPAHAALFFLSRLLPALYLFGVFATAFVFFRQYLRLKRSLYDAVCESGNIWLCENIASPFVIGVLHPRIILPYHMEPEAKKHVLSHEQMHIRHRDPLLHFVGIACSCLHWWNPFVWIAIHKMNQDMEIFCDESVLSLADAPQRKAYAKTLLSFAEQQSSLHAGPAFGESNTERRVKNIMQKKKKNFIVLGLVMLLAVFCAAAFMTIPKSGKDQDVSAGTISGDDHETGNQNNVSKNGAETGNGNSSQIGSNTNFGLDNISSLVKTEENLPAAAGADTEKQLVFHIDPFSALQYASLSIPDFQDKQDMDAAFWKNYLCSTFADASGHSAASAYIIETTTDSPDSDALYNKIMTYDLDAATSQFFGTTLSELGLTPESLADGSSIIYKEGVFGSFWIAVSDQPKFTFGPAKESVSADGKTELVFWKYMEDSGTPLSQITLSLQPAENESGYIIIGKEEKTPASDGGALNADSFPILNSAISLLQQSASFMPDFTEETKLDTAFFQDYLFNSYSRTFDGETVSRHSERRGMKTAYAKVSAKTLDDEIQNLFGKTLSAFVGNPEDLADEYGDIIYEDGYYYIRIPAQSNYVFDKTTLTVAQDGQSAALTFFKRTAYQTYPDSKITLTLKTSETGNGYILTGKEEAEYDFTSLALTGTWLVTGYFIPQQSLENGVSQEEAKTFLSTLLRFGPDSLKVNHSTYPVGEYRRELIAAAEFDDRFHLSAAQDLSIASARFDYYCLQTEEDEPFGSLVYRYDFENALVAYKGILFQITWLTDALDQETIFDLSADAYFAQPDENGFVESALLPSVMLPGSIIYCTDDTHYIIVEGGISLDTLQKAEEFYAAVKASALTSIQNGAKTALSGYHLSDGMSLTYDMYGGMSHIYPRDYPREKLADGNLNWCFENEFCRAVVSGLDGTQPKVFFQENGKDWKIYPIPGFENLTEEERASLVLAADPKTISVTVTKGKEPLAHQIEVDP